MLLAEQLRPYKIRCSLNTLSGNMMALSSYLPVGPLLILASCGVAFAQDMGIDQSVAMPTGQQDFPNYLMQIGPYGALVWGAWALRGMMENLKGGMNINITHKHEFTETGIDAIEKLIVGWKTPSTHPNSKDRHPL